MRKNKVSTSGQLRAMERAAAFYQKRVKQQDEEIRDLNQQIIFFIRYLEGSESNMAELNKTKKKTSGKSEN